LTAAGDDPAGDFPGNWRAGLLLLGGAALAAIPLLLLVWLLPLRHMRHELFSVGLWLLAVAWFVRWEWRANRRSSAGVFLATSMLLLNLYLPLWVLPAMEQQKVSGHLAEALRNLPYTPAQPADPAHLPVYLHGYDSAAVRYFLVEHEFRRLPGPAELAAWAQTTGPAALVMSRQVFLDLKYEEGLDLAAPRHVERMVPLNSHIHFPALTRADLLILQRH